MRSHKLMHQLCRVYALPLSRDTEARFFFDGKSDGEGHGNSLYQFTLASTGTCLLEPPLQFLATIKRTKTNFPAKRRHTAQTWVLCSARRRRRSRHGLCVS